MNVLLITKTLAEFPQEARKVREIARLGVKVSVVVPTTWRGKAVDAKQLECDDYELLGSRCLFSDRKSKKLRNHLHFYPLISNVLGTRRWDAVHVDEEPMNIATYHAMRKCRSRNVPVVFTTWQNVMKMYPPPFEFFEKYVFENASGALAGNSDAVQVLRKRGFEKLIACVPQHGVEPDVFRRRDARELREELQLTGFYVVGYAGQMGLWKGLDTLIKAVALLPRHCVLVFVGSGPDEPKLKRLANDLGLTDRVLWRPWTDQMDIVDYMCAFDVLVLASRTRRHAKEQLGRVLIEAMACETPVVGSDSGEIPNVIGDAGLIFHEGNEQELAGHLRRLMDDVPLRQTLGRRGRERVLERFTYEKIARDTVEFYKTICCA